MRLFPGGELRLRNHTYQRAPDAAAEPPCGKVLVTFLRSSLRGEGLRNGEWEIRKVSKSQILTRNLNCYPLLRSILMRSDSTVGYALRFVQLNLKKATL